MLCWFPFHFQRAAYIILTYGGYWTPTFSKIYKFFHHISGAMYFFNSIANPFLYTFLSKPYRERFRKLIKRLKNCSNANLDSFVTLSNVQSLDRNFVMNHLSTFSHRKCMPNYTAVYKNGEAHISLGQISRFSKESNNTPIVRSTEV